MDREKRRAYNATYDATHREQKRVYDTTRREKRRAYALAHPDQMRAVSAAYRVRKIGSGGSHTMAEWREKCALLGNVCFYCGEVKRLEADHKTPLTRGGTDDITNIVPACRSCNARKGAKTAKEFLATRSTQ